VRPTVPVFIIHYPSIACNRSASSPPRSVSSTMVRFPVRQIPFLKEKPLKPSAVWPTPPPCPGAAMDSRHFPHSSFIRLRSPHGSSRFFPVIVFDPDKSTPLLLVTLVHPSAWSPIPCCLHLVGVAFSPPTLFTKVLLKATLFPLPSHPPLMEDLLN